MSSKNEQIKRMRNILWDHKICYECGEKLQASTNLNTGTLNYYCKKCNKKYKKIKKILNTEGIHIESGLISERRPEVFERLKREVNECFQERFDEEKDNGIIPRNHD